MRCSICRSEGSKEQIIHLPIYVTGSEGIEACLPCRIALSEMVKTMMRLYMKGNKNGYLAAKRVAESAEDY